MPSTFTLAVSTVTYAEEHGELVREDSFSLTADAAFRKTANGWSLSYKESGEQAAATRLSYDKEDDCLTLTRRGAFDYALSLKQDKTFPFLYRVPPAAFDAEVTLLGKQGDMDEAGGLMSLVYMLTVGGTRRKIELYLIAPAE